jgi:endonuclease/exonuclease/phosphatase family metal-dependent hydrolase
MLKVMTLNIQYFGSSYGPWSERRPLIHEAIASTGADIIALQAVRQDPEIDGGLDQASQLAHELPEHRFLFFKAAETDEKGRSNGSAILSRLPFAETGDLKFHLLPGQEDQSQRVLLRARFDLQDSPLHLFNAHFSWVEEQNQMNLEETLPYLRWFPGRALLVGDFNATPESSTMHRLWEYGWTDAWALLRPQEEGFTFVEDGRLSKRIDYVWLNQELKELAQDISLVAEEAGPESVRASDHAGLLLTLDI